MSVNHRPECVCLSSKRLGNKLFRLDIFKKEDRRKKDKKSFLRAIIRLWMKGEMCVVDDENWKLFDLDLHAFFLCCA